MSQSSQLRQYGFAALLTVGGESLTHNVADGSNNSEVVTGLVTRDIVKGKDFLRMLSASPVTFDITGLSVIELPLSMTIAPQAGHNFVDGSSYRHRVNLVVRTDVTFICFCVPTLKS